MGDDVEKHSALLLATLKESSPKVAKECDPVLSLDPTLGVVEKRSEATIKIENG